MDTDEIVKMTVEFWKLIRSYERSVPLLPLNNQAKTHAQIRFSSNQLSNILNGMGINLVTFEGQMFEPNLPVTAVNADEFDGNTENLIIQHTIEPTLVRETSVLAMGKVVLTKGQANVSGD